MLSLSETHVVDSAHEIIESAFELIGWKCVMTTGPGSHDGVLFAWKQSTVTKTSHTVVAKGRILHVTVREACGFAVSDIVCTHIHAPTGRCCYTRAPAKEDRRLKGGLGYAGGSCGAHWMDADSGGRSECGAKGG
eukprot:2466537-Prymnesium_polylepis.1